MGDKVRHIRIEVQYAGATEAQRVTKHVLSFDYIDVVDGKNTDSLNLVFEDSEGHWKNKWFPERGKFFTAGLSTRDWPGKKTLSCGAFELDDIIYAGPPNTCSISALAVGITSSLRRERKSKAWEHFNVRQIAQEVAGNHGFTLEYEGGETQELDRFDQREQSDIEMLALLCEKYGLGLAVTDKKIRIFDAVEGDARGPEITFIRNENGYMRHDLRVGSSDVFSGVELKYVDPTEKLLVKYEYNATAGKWSSEKPPSKYILKLNERCKTEAEAERIAKAALREKNKREATGSITVLGDPDIRAGKTMALSGFGKFDEGQYFIEQARHHYDKQGGYTTTAEFRGTLDY